MRDSHSAALRLSDADLACHYACKIPHPFRRRLTGRRSQFCRPDTISAATLHLTLTPHPSAIVRRPELTTDLALNQLELATDLALDQLELTTDDLACACRSGS